MWDELRCMQGFPFIEFGHKDLFYGRIVLTFASLHGNVKSTDYTLNMCNNVELDKYQKNCGPSAR